MPLIPRRLSLAILLLGGADVAQAQQLGTVGGGVSFSIPRGISLFANVFVSDKIALEANMGLFGYHVITFGAAVTFHPLPGNYKPHLSIGVLSMLTAPHTIYGEAYIAEQDTVSLGSRMLYLYAAPGYAFTHNTGADNGNLFASLGLSLMISRQTRLRLPDNSELDMTEHPQIVLPYFGLGMRYFPWTETPDDSEQ